MQSGSVVGIDLGGTKVLAGVVDSLGGLGKVVVRSTPGRTVEPAVLEDLLTSAVDEIAQDHQIAAVGLGAAGFVSAGRVRFAPHLSWRDDDVAARLSSRWGVPVALDNDANCAALAESRFGAARDAGSALVITLGTGIGGAVLIEGRLWRGASGMAGEFGHMQVVPDGIDCPCGGRGCWERYCSGTALTALAGRPGHEVTKAARAGDRDALAALAEVGRWLGVGLAGLVAAFDPELVVIGGGLSAAGDLMLDPARATFAESLVGQDYRPSVPVIAAALGPEAGMIGAGVLAGDLAAG